ncbi:MAG: hypothetical protein JW822_12475 [Spirochaetales bacterium]|nr:hypothetical protein [Spirochaetales bacterium]
MNILKKRYSYPNLSFDQRLYTKNDHDKHFFSILRRSGLYNLNPKDIKLTRAFSIKDLYNAYTLVHEQYTAKRYLQPSIIGIRIRDFELSNKIATFIAKKQYKIIGVCSLIIDSPEKGLPCDKIYAKELNEIRRNSTLLCEATNEVLHKNFRRSTVLTELLRCVFAHALYNGCDKMLIEVSNSHKRFYELNYFNRIGPIRNYSDDLYDPVILMYSDLHKLVKTFLFTDEDSDPLDTFLSKFYYTHNPYINYVQKWDFYKGIQKKNMIKLIKILQQKYKNKKYCKNIMKKKLFSRVFLKTS